MAASLFYLSRTLEKVVFCGRLRPALINIWWLRAWVISRNRRGAVIGRGPLSVTLTPQVHESSYIESRPSPKRADISQAYWMERSKKMAQEQFRCGECGESFTSQSALEEHNRMAHSLYTCEACRERFGSERQMEEHKREVHPDLQRTLR